MQLRWPLGCLRQAVIRTWGRAERSLPSFPHVARSALEARPCGVSSRGSPPMRSRLMAAHFAPFVPLAGPSVVLGQVVTRSHSSSIRIPFTASSVGSVSLQLWHCEHTLHSWPSSLPRIFETLVSSRAQKPPSACCSGWFCVNPGDQSWRVRKTSLAGFLWFLPITVLPQLPMFWSKDGGTEAGV